MRAARILLATVLVGLGLTGFTTAPAFACSCALAGVPAQLSWSDAVFVGTLTDRIQEGDDTSGSVTYTFDVSEVYKGTPTSPAEVTTGVQSSACGMPGLSEGTAYVVFAAGGDSLSTGSCSGTAEATPGLVDQIDQLAGPPHEPTAAPPDERPPPLAIAAVVAAAVAVLATVVRAVRVLLR